MPHLIVLNKDEDTVSIIDVTTHQEVKRITVDYNPHEVVVSPDKSKFFVTCSLGNSLWVFDSKSFEVLDRITHKDFDFPHGVAVSKKSNELYLASTYSNQFFVFDCDTHALKLQINTYQGLSHMVTLSPDENLAYIPNIGSNNVSIYDTNKQVLINHFPVGKGPEGLAVHKNGDIYVANQHDDMVVVYDPITLKEKYKVRTGKLPIRAMFTPDYSYLFVPNRESHDVSIIDPSYSFCGQIRPYEVKRLPLGRWSGGVIFDSQGQYAYVANNKTNDISVIDIKTLNLVTTIPVGIHPDGIAYLD